LSAWTDTCAAILALTCNRGELISHAEIPWASIGFSGTRHTLVLKFTGEEAIDFGNVFVAGLDSHDIRIAGQLVADAVVLERLLERGPEPVMTMKIELLLLEWEKF